MGRIQEAEVEASRNSSIHRPRNKALEFQCCILALDPDKVEGVGVVHQAALHNLLARFAKDRLSMGHMLRGFRMRDRRCGN